MMEFATPFGIRRQPSAAPEASQGARINTQRFSELKPICVELLGSIAGVKQVDTQNKIQLSLKRLHTKLSTEALFADAGSSTDVHPSGTSRIPLSQALISYIFFPVAQLLRVADQLPAKQLPDRLQCLVFLVVADLCNDWWLAWTSEIRDDAAGQAHGQSAKKLDEQLQVWHQLLFLSASALAPSLAGSTREPRTDRSEETLQAALSMVDALLAPRVMQSSMQSSQDTTPSLGFDEVDWDDELCLPSLDDYDNIMEAEKLAAAASQKSHDDPCEPRQVYPSKSHQSSVTTSKGTRGAIAHLLMTSLAIARASKHTTDARVQALHIVRTITATWIAGDKHAARLLDEEAGGSRYYTLVEGQTLQKESASPAFSKEATERVAMFLPGLVSGLVGILSASSEGVAAVRSVVIADALKTLSLCIVLCFSNERGMRFPSSSFASDNGEEETPTSLSLEEIFRLDEGAQHSSKPEHRSVIVSTDDHGTSAIPGKAQESGGGDKYSGHESQEWIQSTVSHIAASFIAIAHHRYNSNGSVRQAFAEMAGSIVVNCSNMLLYQAEKMRHDDYGSRASPGGVILPFLTNTMLDIAADETDSRSASDTATQQLLKAISQSSKAMRKAVISTIGDELHGSLRRLRGCLTRTGGDKEVCMLALRLPYLLRLITGDVEASFCAFDMLAPVLESDERWIIGLLGSFNLNKGNEPDAFEIAGFTSHTSKTVQKLFEAMGVASARAFEHDCLASDSKATSTALGLLDKVLRIGAHWRPSAVSHGQDAGQSIGVNAVFVAAGMMTGVATILDDGTISKRAGRNQSRLRRRAQRFAKGLIDLVIGVWEADEEQLMDGSRAIRAPLPSDSDHAVVTSNADGAEQVQEYRRGDALPSEKPEAAFQLGPAVRLDFLSAASLIQSKAPQALKVVRHSGQVARVQDADVLLLSIVASASKILGPALKGSMLKLLYPIISAAASDAAEMQSAASSCLGVLAHSAGYASIQGCILDHADYILGAASHRLVSTLALELQSSSGRGTRITQERLPSAATRANTTGQSIVAKFNSTDYRPLMSAQSAPLVLIEIVRMLGTEAVALIEDAIDEVLDAVDKFHLDPVTCDALLNVLDRLVEVMQSDVLKSEVLPLRKKHGQLAIMPNDEAELSAFEQWIVQRRNARAESDSRVYDEADDSTTAPEEKDATRSQEVAIAMLYKALPFVSHSAWTIRLRCLRLLNRGIDMLCLQGRTIEPLAVVSSLWPLLMARLGFTLSHSVPDINARLLTYDALEEQSFAVYLEAVDLVGTLSHHLADFLGSEKLLRQALPRLLLLLKIVEKARERQDSATSAAKPATFRLESGSKTDALLVSKTEDVNVTAVAMATKDAPRLYRRFSPLALLIEHIIIAVDKLVAAMGASLTEEDLFALATHPTLLCCLDDRQVDDIRRPAWHLYNDTLLKRNENLVWYVLSAAVGTADTPVPRFPSFLQIPGLRTTAAH